MLKHINLTQPAMSTHRNNIFVVFLTNVMVRPVQMPVPDSSVGRASD